MRVVIDLQLCQVQGPDTPESRFLLELTRALITHLGEDSIWVALSENFPDSARALRTEFIEVLPQTHICTASVPSPGAESVPENKWRARAGELTWERFLQAFDVDVILIPSLFLGFDSDATASVGRLAGAPNTVVLLSESITAIRDRLRAPATEGWEAFFHRRLQALKNSAAISTLSEDVRAEVVGTLSCDPERVTALLTGDLPEPVADLSSTELPLQVAQQLCVLFDALEVTNIQEALPPTRQHAQKRPRLAFVSPFPPDESGIADHSADLVPELARYYDIDLITPRQHVTTPALAANFPVHGVDWFDSHADDYDRILYQVGNSPYHTHMPALISRHPGVVVLHDFFISHMLAAEREKGAEFVKALHSSHGFSALQQLQEEGLQSVVWQYPTNYDVLMRAEGVIVHSSFAMQLAENWYGRNVGRRLAEVPLLRRPPPPVSKAEARRNLGIPEHGFVVCSFGMLGPTKLNDRLLDAWRSFSGALESDTRLVFVGREAEGQYGTQIADLISDSGLSEVVTITGFVEPDEYRFWLSAADVAVQLRCDTRGETSAALLDCFAAGIPAIYNAHGAAAALPDRLGVKLADEVTPQSLCSALESLYADNERRQRLGLSGKEYVEHIHAPEPAARKCRDAIEEFYSRSVGAVERNLISCLRRIDSAVPAKREDLAVVSEAAAQLRPDRRRRLYVDVSPIAREDLRTGIQRVVRAQLKALFTDPPEGFHVEPVTIAQTDGVWHFRTAMYFSYRFLGLNLPLIGDEPISPRNGDVFFGADLNGAGVIAADRQGLFQRWKARGVGIFFNVYDILPVTNPEWFPPQAGEHHEQWLSTVTRHADGLICISNDVAQEVEQWFENKGEPRPDPLRIGANHLGADIEKSSPSLGLPSDAAETLLQLKSRPTFILVGTIEPRKGYDQVLDGFERLWSDGRDVNLVIVGQEGWKHVPDQFRGIIPSLVNRFQNHEEEGKHFFWFSGVSDEYLEKIYDHATCLIAASYNEGFGLPLIEAAQRGVPVIARDIPVFREVAGDSAFYFSGMKPEAIAQAVNSWLEMLQSHTYPDSNDMPWSTWEENVERLKKLIRGRDWGKLFPGGARGAVSEPKPARESAPVPGEDLQELRYLEQVIDTRGGREGGPLAGKEIIVYAPPKTGSLSLYAALRDYYAPRRHWQVPDSHVLHDHGQASLLNVLQLPEGLTTETLNRRHVMKDLLEYKRLHGESVQIVSSYREPLGRAISLVFQEIQDLVFREEQFEIKDVTHEYSYERLIRLLGVYAKRPHPIEEFDPGFFEEHTFDHETKSCFVNAGHYQILLLCLEHVDKWAAALEREFRCQGIQIAKHNSADAKEVARLYKEFKAWLKLDRETIETVYYGRHRQAEQLRWFYTDKEIRKFFERAIEQYGSSDAKAS